MSKYASHIKRFGRDCAGATALEYTAAGAFIATAALGLAGAIGTTIKAESYATLLNGQVLLASSKKDAVRIAARNTSDPIQTGSTSAPKAEISGTERARQRALKRAQAKKKANAIPFCNAGEHVRPCKMDMSKPVFKHWRGTVAEWLPDH